MKLLTLTGPSCSGKTTLLNELVANHGFKALVSCTTRPPRTGEEYGKDYYFLSDDIFEHLKSKDMLMESVEFNGYKYGLSSSEAAAALSAGKTPVVIVEPNGLRQVSKYCKDHGIQMLRVFIGGDLQTLMKRYLMRSADEDMSDESIASRNAKRLASLVFENASWKFLLEDPYSEHSDSLYDIKISEYNESNQESIIKQIKESYGQS